MVHKDIRIPFEIDDRRYEAIGFLDKDEFWIRGDEMLLRTGSSNNIIGEDDVVFINERLHLLPEDLRKFQHLVTNQRKPDGERSMRIFCCHDGSWCMFWSHLDCIQAEDGLVVRRLP